MNKMVISSNVFNAFFFFWLTPGGKGAGCCCLVVDSLCWARYEDDDGERCLKITSEDTLIDKLTKTNANCIPIVNFPFISSIPIAVASVMMKMKMTADGKSKLMKISSRSILLTVLFSIGYNGFRIDMNRRKDIVQKINRSMKRQK